MPVIVGFVTVVTRSPLTPLSDAAASANPEGAGVLGGGGNVVMSVG